jgi:SAM-dependent methyltransferase
MGGDQTSAFLGGEGDKWFERNREALQRRPADAHDIPLSMIAEVMQPGGSILEIGCSNGNNLAELNRRVPIRGFGIDPSVKAVAEGAALAPAIQLSVGAANALQYPGEHFDVVWFGFCLYLIDRSFLAAAVAEADRVLRDGGYLAITDFDPPYPCRQKYHHLAGVNSYKADYSKLFLGNPAYALAAKRSYSHAGRGFHADPNERVATWVLAKSMTNAYQDLG